jgi:transcriptional regulator with XRE-family HTH domain
LRKNAGFKSQAEFAKIFGIPQKTYSNYESGKNEPQIATLIKFADYFGCSVDYLIGHETSGILHLDSFTEQQKKLIDLVCKLSYDQANIVIGRLSEMLHLPYDDAKPVRPW